MFVIVYKVYFFVMFKVLDLFVMSNVFFVMGIFVIFFNSLIVVCWGRCCVIFIVGLVICGIFQLIIVVVYYILGVINIIGIVLVVLICVYMMIYNGMIFIYVWFVGGEIFFQCFRSYIFGFVVVVGFFGVWFIIFIVLYFINFVFFVWGFKYGFIWFFSCIIGVFWVLFFLFEIKGCIFEEIDEMFEVKLFVCKFRYYICVGYVNIVEKIDDCVLEKVSFFLIFEFWISVRVMILIFCRYLLRFNMLK